MGERRQKGARGFKIGGEGEKQGWKQLEKQDMCERGVKPCIHPCEVSELAIVVRERTQLLFGFLMPLLLPPLPAVDAASLHLLP
jgi:hypothetical protein